MVALQILNRVLQTKDDSIIENNLLTVEHFIGYEDEFNFIQGHKEKYGNIPDRETFLSHFPDFEVLDVTESEKYLVDTLQEEFLYAKSVPVIQKAAELLKTDSNEAAHYIASQVPNLQPNYHIGGTDAVSGALNRVKEFEERKTKQQDWYFESGFKELDDIWHGIQRGEELLVIVARTNQGKSWVLEKMCAHVWKTGFNVGYFSPEMSASTVGFRFDTLVGHFSNKALMWGKSEGFDEDAYKKYVEDISKRDNKFVVTTPVDFDRQVTVSKLRNWVRQFKLDMIAIDGITYISDERGHRNDNKTTSLTNISEDLMALSVELKIPILIVVQANRNGVSGAEEDGTPELESIRDSDGIAHNASKVLSLKQKSDGVLEMGIKKQRNGAVGGRLEYTWKIDTGEFIFNGEVATRRKHKEENTERKPKSGTDVF